MQETGRVYLLNLIKRLLIFSNPVLKFSILHSHEYFEFCFTSDTSNSVSQQPCLRVEKSRMNLIGQIFYF